LKYGKPICGIVFVKSSPSRGTWVEIKKLTQTHYQWLVVPLAGDVG